MENSSFIYKNILLLIAQPTSALLISYSRYSAKLHSGELAGIFYFIFHPGPENSAYGSLSLCFHRPQDREMNAEKWRKAEKQGRKRKVSAWGCCNASVRDEQLWHSQVSLGLQGSVSAPRLCTRADWEVPDPSWSGGFEPL